MFKLWGSQDQANQPHPQEISTQCWNSPSVASSPSSSCPSTPGSGSGSGSAGNLNLQRLLEQPYSPSHISPAEAAGMINTLKDKSVDELRNLLSDKDAYNQILPSLDQIMTQNKVLVFSLSSFVGSYLVDRGRAVWDMVRDELRKQTLLLASVNIEKEATILELRNQCRIIWTTELAAARERLNELEKQKDEILMFYSPASLLRRLQEAMGNAEECETVRKQFVAMEMDVWAFVHNFKRLRAAYHRQALMHLSAKSSCI